jgi:hypothetical protein
MTFFSVEILFLFLCNLMIFILNPYLLSGSRDSVVGIATGYGLDDRVVGVRAPVR